MRTTFQRTLPPRQWLGALVLVGLLMGCSEEVAQNYTVREDVSKLPKIQQDQVHDVLSAYFGTPQSPRFVLPDRALYEDEQKIELKERMPSSQLKRGQQVYLAQCAACHGATGDGAGLAAQYLNPKPRDYRRGVFKFTSTPYSAKPRREDLRLTVRRGAKGTSMPAFRTMEADDMEAVIDYVIYLSYRGEIEYSLAQVFTTDLTEGERMPDEGVVDIALYVESNWESAVSQQVLPKTIRPDYTDDSIALGKVAFLIKGCAKCHGIDGRGFTQDNVGKDAWNQVVKAADLTSGLLHGGRRPIDVYRRIHNGINGTPMPAFDKALAEDPDTMWHLAHYVLALAEGRKIPDVELPDVPLQGESADGASAAELGPAEESADGNLPAEEEATAP